MNSSRAFRQFGSSALALFAVPFAGAGAIRSTTIDMPKFAVANPHPERGALRQAMWFAHEERAPAGGPNRSIGLNWMILHAGVFQIATQFALGITVRDGALYVHPTGQATLRLWPETAVDFFIKEVDPQVTFVPDARGR